VRFVTHRHIGEPEVEALVAALSSLLESPSP
jgi:hypothetical protein